VVKAINSLKTKIERPMKTINRKMTLNQYLEHRCNDGQFSTDRVLTKIGHADELGRETFETSDGHKLVIEFSEWDELCGNIVEMDGALVDA